MLVVFDHKYVSLFKKRANSPLKRIYSKKLLTGLAQLRIMRPVLSDKATIQREQKNWKWLLSSVG
ncbi:hypothetical protein FCV43_06880 [Vibrio genomosp. F6]